MIHRIFSDLPSFKEIQFRQDLNVLVAEKSPGATDRQTRNRAGKSSLIEIIHFLTGANVDKASIFRTPDLEPYYFGMALDLNGSRAQVRRSGSAPSEVVIEEGRLLDWAALIDAEVNDDRLTISNSKWRELLGHLMFGLPAMDDADQRGRFAPTFRSLFSYFVRRQGAAGFSAPTKQSGMQQLFDQQVAVSFLLGLDWTIPQLWQEVRERERSLSELRKAASAGTLGTVIESAAELRSRLAVAEERSRRLTASVQDFQVLPEYRHTEEEASRIARELGDLADDNSIDEHLLADLEDSLRRDIEPSIEETEKLYNEIGVFLPDLVVRRFEEVRAFHQSVVENRRSYLGGEIQSAGRRLSRRRERMRLLADRQSQLMSLLQSHGALEQLVRLQAELTRVEAETEAIRQRHFAAEQLESQRTELTIERQQLLLRLRQDYREQSETLRHAIVLFEEISSALYEEAGVFTIEESENGPQFEFKIQGAKSKGISNMQIFCFDMTIMKISVERGLGPGFLIHDSHLFDGVDERQIARALEIGEREARTGSFQYIVTMNSDDVPHESPMNVDLNEHILPVRLTDKTEEGGLFGIRF